MDWGNEYWVRSYVKDSPSFSMCSWQARALFFLIHRRVNADGVLMLEPGDPVTSAMYIADQVRAPWDEISGPIIELIKSGTIEIPTDWSRLRIPNFREAQSAVWTDSFRMKTMRQRRKETASGTGANFVPADPETIIRDIPRTLSPTIPYMPTGQELRVAEEANRSPGSGEVVNGTFVPRTLDASPVTPRNAPLSDYPARVTPRNEMFDTDQKDLSDPSDHSRRHRQLLSGEGQEQESPAEAEREETKPLTGPTETSSRLVTDNPQLALIPGEEPAPDPDAVSRHEVAIVWDHYFKRWQSLRDKKRFGGIEPKLSKTTKGHICARIREFGVDNVVRAIDKLFDNPWRTDAGYFGIQYVVRSTEQFQMLMMRNDASQGPRRGAFDQPQQRAPKKTYVGRGVQTGPDGRVYDHRGNVVEIDDELPVDFGLPGMRA